MNTYQAFYRNRSIQVEAETSFKAQAEAAAKFEARRSWEVTVVLIAKAGEQVTFDTAGL
jgi:hypothetical protein